MSGYLAKACLIGSGLLLLNLLGPRRRHGEADESEEEWVYRQW